MCVCKILHIWKGVKFKCLLIEWWRPPPLHAPFPCSALGPLEANPILPKQKIGRFLSVESDQIKGKTGILQIARFLSDHPGMKYCSLTQFIWSSFQCLTLTHKCTAKDSLFEENVKHRKQRPKQIPQKNSRDYRDSAGSWRKQQRQTPNLFIPSRERKVATFKKSRTRCRGKSKEKEIYSNQKKLMEIKVLI